MDNVTNVTPVMYSQSRQTKLGLAVVTIRQEGDLFESTVTISHSEGEKQVIFRAEGIFSSAREADDWSYGVKQRRNDRYAGYTAKEGMLIETKPAKGKIAEVISVEDALIESQVNYDNWIIGKSSTVSDNISMSAIKSSKNLTVEDQATLDRLFAKAKGRLYGSI